MSKSPDVQALLLKDKEVPAEEIPNYISGADVVVSWREMDEAGYVHAELFRGLDPIKMGGNTIYPPIFVMDSDDAVDWVHPFNYAFASLGIRDFDGRVLSPGEFVSWTNKDASITKLWEDKKTRGQSAVVFDIARNLKSISYHYDACRAAAGVTVTCEPLAKAYREQGVENVYVYPNSIIPEDHHFPPLQPHSGIRILWEGGGSHVESWIPIKQGLIEVLRENPQAKLVVYGSSFPWMGKEIPKDQIEIHDWTDYAAYKLMRATLTADINLCPLLDMPFTRCKSAIRWYEGSLGPNPEPALAANVGPYKEIVDGETGLLYNNPQEFKEKLTALIHNADLRKRLGVAGQKWVLDNRTAEKTVPGLLDFYKELKAKQRQEALRP
jgi:hypothetical protein